MKITYHNTPYMEKAEDYNRGYGLFDEEYGIPMFQIGVYTEEDYPIAI